MASMSRCVSRRSSIFSMLVMLELRISSSLTTLSMSFFESWSRMRIFHYGGVSAGQAMDRNGFTHVAPDHLADGVENHCITCQLVTRIACAQYTWTYARAGSRSWTPSWRGTAACAGRMQRKFEGVRSCTRSGGVMGLREKCWRAMRRTACATLTGVGLVAAWIVLRAEHQEDRGERESAAN